MNNSMVAYYVLNLNALNARMDIIFNLIQIIIRIAINQFKELVSNAMKPILDVLIVIKMDA